MAETPSFQPISPATFTPFWRRFPSFFIYPMQVGTLFRLSLYSATGGLSLLISGVFGTGMQFVVGPFSSGTRWS